MTDELTDQIAAKKCAGRPRCRNMKKCICRQQAKTLAERSDNISKQKCANHTDFNREFCITNRTGPCECRTQAYKELN